MTEQAAHRVPGDAPRDELNPEQRAVVECTAGPMLVIAGAGSGKTRVIVHRMANLVRLGVAPESILLLTFTKKAAEEMLTRANGMIAGIAADGRFFGGTFHHFCNRMLRLFPEEAGLPSSFTILDSEDSDDLIGDCRIELVEKRLTAFELPKCSQIRKILSLSENLRRPIAEVLETQFPAFLGLVEPLERLRDLYAAKKRDAGVVDFDDLLTLTLRLLETNAEVLERVRAMFAHVMVDEYQDTNIPQARIALLLSERHRNLMVVGDDMQSIYAFRGAHHKNILDFPNLIPGTRVFTLSTNYRSTPPLLSFANAIVRGALHGFKRDLVPVRAGGAVPDVMQLPDDAQEATHVAEEIVREIDSGVPPNEIAVLYRAHSHSLRVQTELLRRGVVFALRSGKKFTELAHVKDLFAFYRVVVNPRDAVALARLLRLAPGVGKKSVERIVAAVLDGTFTPAMKGMRIPEKARGAIGKLFDSLRSADAKMKPDAAATAFVATFYGERIPFVYDDAEERARDVEALVGLAGEYDSVETMVSELALSDDVSSRPGSDAARNEPAVVLSSVHQAKGLEWRSVHLLRFQDGAFPTAQALDDPSRLEEERRLFYVAVTRAKERLTLYYPMVASGYNSYFARVSRFLESIPEERFRFKVKRPF